jgi:nucleoside-diphosphate-sugar epimerase
MPTVSSGKVLVTGANGFIAVYVIKDLLERGYTIRGTVRSLSKTEHLKKLFKDHLDKIEFVEVTDITLEGAFDEHVKGVDAILHLATPISNPDPNPDTFAKPAIEGTVSVINSALKHGTAVKRIVVTSSAGAIRGIPKSYTVYDETNWADDFIALVKEQGEKAGLMEKYRASKALAERAAWDIYNANKATIAWDLTVLNPPVVLGPAIQETTTLEKVNDSNAMFTKIFQNPQPDAYLSSNIALVDVRDVSIAHIIALQKEEAGGERFIISGWDENHQDIIDVIHAIKPSPPWIHKVPVGKPGQVEKKPLFTFSNAKSIKVLGIKYYPLQETIKDTWDDFYAKGWFN